MYPLPRSCWAVNEKTVTPHNSKKLAFVVVDGEYRDNYKLALERDGFTVESFESEQPALDRLKHLSPDIAIVHFGQDMSRTIEFIKNVHSLDPTVSIIYFTLYMGEKVQADAIRAGAYAVDHNPSGIYNAEFLAFLRDALRESKKKKRSALAKRQALLVMPFATEFDDRHTIVREVFADLGYKCVRMDDLQYLGNIVHELYDKLVESQFIVADISGNNPNVFYELGYADALEKTVIVLKHQDSVAPFDVSGRRLIIYNKMTDLKEKLIAMVNGLTAT